MTHRFARPQSIPLLAVLGLLLSLALSSSAWAAAPGQIDPSFGSNGLASTGANTRLLATAVQPDGKVVAVGASGIGSMALHLLVVRFTSSGQLDSSFSGGAVTSLANVLGQGVAIDPNGKIVVVGTATDPSGSSNQGLVVERLNTNGTPDGGFGSGGAVSTLTGGHGQGNAVALDGNEIVAVGDGSITNGLAQDQGFPGVAIVRISPTGHVDTSTVYDLGRFSIATGVAVQPDGKFVISGTQRGDLQTTQTLAARFNSDGTRDSSFAGGLFVHQYSVGAAYSGFNSVALQSDGKVVLAGGTTNGAQGVTALFVRLTSSGAPDGSFGFGGQVQSPDAKSSQAASSESAPYGALGVLVSGSTIIATGWFDDFGQRSLALWGLNSNGSLDSGFGTQGVTIMTGTGGSLQGNGIGLAPDGKLLVSGELDSIFPQTMTGVELRFIGLPVSPASFTVTVKVKSVYKRAVVRKHGIGGIAVSCNRNCSISLSLLTSAQVAKSLHIKHTVRRCSKVRGRRKCTKYGVLATPKGTLRSAGQKNFTLNNALIRKAAHKFSTLKLTLSVTVVSNGTRRAVDRSITVR